MKNDLISIDIVFLPPKNIQKLCIDINKKLTKRYGEKIRLGFNKGVPHITLTFACISRSMLSELYEKIEEFSNNMQSQKLSLESLEINDRSTSFNVSVTQEIIDFRNKIINFIKQIHVKSSDYDTFAYVEGFEINSDHLLWVNEYIYMETFWPHISLGFGKISYNKLPLGFSCSEIAVYQLGYSCTCQKLLFKKTL